METENKLECWAFIQVFIVFPPPPPPPPPPPHYIVCYPSPTRYIFFVHEIL